jgi:hypothetical protein
MQCKLDLIILTKTKENDPVLRIVRIWWQNALNTITNDLMQVSIPAEEDHNSHQPSHMRLRDQYFHGHTCS